MPYSIDLPWSHLVQRYGPLEMAPSGVSAQCSGSASRHMLGRVNRGLVGQQLGQVRNEAILAFVSDGAVVNFYHANGRRGAGAQGVILQALDA